MLVTYPDAHAHKHICGTVADTPPAFTARYTS